MVKGGVLHGRPKKSAAPAADPPQLAAAAAGEGLLQRQTASAVAVSSVSLGQGASSRAPALCAVLPRHAAVPPPAGRGPDPPGEQGGEPPAGCGPAGRSGPVSRGDLQLLAADRQAYPSEGIPGRYGAVLGPDRQRCGRGTLPTLQSDFLDDTPHAADGGGAVPPLPRRVSRRQPDPALRQRRHLRLSPPGSDDPQRYGPTLSAQCPGRGTGIRGRVAGYGSAALPL